MEPCWPPSYRRDAAVSAGIVVLFLAVLFSPFLVGPYSLMTAAIDVPSIYPGGAAPGDFVGFPRKELDPGGGGDQSEAWVAIQHDIERGDGRGPWWDPYEAYGQPFAAAQQTQPFYPLTFAASLHPSARVWSWYIVARFALAGVFGALFVLFFGSRTAAVAGGIATALCGYFVAYYSMPHLSVEVLAPALLWACEYLLRRPGPGSVATTAAVFAAEFFGGMPESMVLAVGSAFVYVVVRLAFERRLYLFALLPFGAAFALGTAVAGASLLPLAELLARSFDTHRTAAVALGLTGENLPLAKSLMLQLAPLAYGAPFGDLTGPGPTGMQGYVGAVVALGALAAVAAAFRRDVPIAVRGAVAALAIVVAFSYLKNQQSPLVNWVGALPVARLVIFYKYDQALIGVGCGLLCGLGVTAVERAWVRSREIALAYTLVLATIVVCFAYEIAHVVAPSPGPLYFAVAFAVVTLCAAALALSLRSRAGYAGFALVVGIAAAGQYYVPMYGLLSRIPSVHADPYRGGPYVTELRNRLGGSRERVLGLAEMLGADWGGASGLDTPESLNALYPARYLPFLRRFLGSGDPSNGDLVERFVGFSPPSLATELAHRWLTLSSVRFVVIPPEKRLHGTGLGLVYDRDARIYAFDSPLPRASIFHRVRTVRDGDAALAALAAPAFDLRRELVLEAPAPDRPGPPAGNEHAAIAVRGAGMVAIEATLSAPGYVLLNDTWYPGWVATVDGQETPVLQADYLFRAVAVPAGSHRIVYTYRSAAVRNGVIASVLGLLILLGCAVAAARSKRARAKPASTTMEITP